VFTQYFIKLSAAVHELCLQREKKLSCDVLIVKPQSHFNYLLLPFLSRT